MSNPTLADLAVFVAVAQARSFRGAAKLRNESPSALSGALRRLEARLKVRLLNRTTRSVTPTDAGQRLLERLQPALREVTSAVDEIVEDEGRIAGTLRLNVPSAVADLVLPQILVRFLSTYPAITVEIAAENTFMDVLAAGFDAGIRYTERIERDMIAIPIGPREQRHVTAASPAYLERHGMPRHPNDLLDHACIRYRFSSGVTPAWEFAKNGQTAKVSPDGSLVANRIELLLAAAKAGLGLIHSFEGFIAPAVASGELDLVLEDWSEPYSGPHLYYPSRRHMPGPLRAFVDFIKQEDFTG